MTNFLGRYLLVLSFLLGTLGNAQNLSRRDRMTIETNIRLIKMTSDPTKMLFLIGQILKLDSSNTDAIAYRAFAHTYNKDTSSALKDYDFYMRKKPSSSFCLYRGWLKTQLRDTSAAVKDFDKALLLSGNDPVIFRKIEGTLKINKLTVSYCENILKFHPNTILAYEVLGMVREKEKDFTGAFKNYEIAVKLLDADPFSDRIEHWWIFELKAGADYELKHYAQAAEAISESILLKPENRPYSYRERLKYYAASGEQRKSCDDTALLQEIDSTYNTFFKVKCDNLPVKNKTEVPWRAHVKAGDYYLKGYASKGNDSTKIKEAIYYYSKALEIDPDHLPALAGRASYYMLLKKFDKALSDLDRILKINPKCASAHHYRATVNRSLNKYAEAVKDAGNAIRYDSTNVSYWVHRAAIQSDIGDAVKAIADLSKSIKLNSYHAPAYFERGILELYAKKDYSAALKDFLKAIEIQENQPLEKKDDYYYSFCAEAYDKLQMYNEALTAMDKAIAIEPRSSYHYYYSGEIKARMKDMTGACEDWHTSEKMGYEKAEELILYNCK